MMILHIHIFAMPWRDEIKILPETKTCFWLIKASKAQFRYEKRKRLFSQIYAENSVT